MAERKLLYYNSLKKQLSIKLDKLCYSQKQFDKLYEDLNNLILEVIAVKTEIFEKQLKEINEDKSIVKDSKFKSELLPNCIIRDKKTGLEKYALTWAQIRTIIREETNREADCIEDKLISFIQNNFTTKEYGSFEIEEKIKSFFEEYEVRCE